MAIMLQYKVRKKNVFLRWFVYWLFSFANNSSNVTKLTVIGEKANEKQLKLKKLRHCWFFSIDHRFDVWLKKIF